MARGGVYPRRSDQRLSPDCIAELLIEVPLVMWRALRSAVRQDLLRGAVEPVPLPARKGIKDGVQADDARTGLP